MTDKEFKDQVVKILADRGIRISVSACGCCGSPWVSLEVDGKLIVDNEEDFSFGDLVVEGAG